MTVSRLISATVLTIAFLPLHAAKPAKTISALATGFGHVKVNRSNVQIAVREGEAAQQAARNVLALPMVRFTIAEAGFTNAIWGDLDSHGAPIYPWVFRKISGAQDQRPPNYVLRHEIGHDLFIRYLVPSSRDDQYGGDAPDWLDEMAAVAFEGPEQRASRRDDAGRYAREATLIPLSRFLTMTHPELTAKPAPASSGQAFRTLPASSNETPQFYAMARAFYDFLVARTKSTAIVAELAVAVRNGEPIDRWLLARTGHGSKKDGLKALNTEFLAWIASDKGYDVVPEQLQGEVKPTAPAQPAPGQTPPAQIPVEPAKDAPPRKMEFRGPDGEPLSPEIRQQLEEQFKNDPPPVARNDPPPVASPDAPLGGRERDILVTGQRPRGSVVGDIPPERTFNPLDIRAYGATDIGELLQTLGPQVSSNRGREDSNPVVLLNGKRVSSFAEIAKIPTEAIERMEVFPEELALKYGYRADQKVVNVVAFERFSSRVGQLAYTTPTEGGRDTAGINANYLRIQGDTRVNLDADYSRSGSLLESERDVLQIQGAPDLGRSRTLLPETERLALNGTVSSDVLSGLSSTLNGRFEANKSESLLGLGVNGPLTRDTNTHVAHLGALFGGQIRKWLWSFTGNYDRISTDTFTDANNALGAQDEARSVNSLANAELVFSGSVLKLPAGPVLASVRGSAEMRDFKSRSLRGGEEQRAELSRNRNAIQANLDVPIASRREKGATWLGNLSANANLEIAELSDVGTLRTFGYGLNWSPIGEINLIASATNEEGAPTVEQFGAPLVVTPNVRTFDFTRREVVDITQVFGGNPGLRSDDRHIVRLGVNAKPFPTTDFSLSVDYIKTRIDNPSALFPIATPEIEAAFPERFTRDIDGRLLRIDSRPLNFKRADQEQLRWGVNFTRPLGPLPPGMQNTGVRFVGSEADLQRALPPGAKIIRAEAGSPAARRFENMASRLFLGFYHTWRLEDEILVREGVPALNLLNGSAIDSRGGRPRHELEFQAGAFKRGLGARVTANWRSGTTVRGLPAGTSGTTGDLSFSDYATVNINVFANLADRLGGAKAPEWLKGTRFSIGINNLFNSRPKVLDEAGATPLSYQPAYLDPPGRLVNFNLRKAF